MFTVVATQYNGKILGPIAWLLGKLMNGIFIVLSSLGIGNIGLAIILFTFVIYMLLMPLTVKQQKFSKLQQKMAPEMKAIQEKYKGRKDNDAMMAQQQELKALNAKYGVSQTGSCVQMLIQFPILYALYFVINAIPAYVTQVKDVFAGLADQLITQPGSTEFMQGLSGAARFTKQFSDEAFTSGVVNDFTRNTFIDVLNKASTADWASLSEKFSSLAPMIQETQTKVASMNNFLGLNIGDSPSFLVREAFSSRSFLLLIAAVAVPALSAITQWINVKLMPQAPTPANADPNDTATQMANSMKSMTYMMPLVSAFMCFTLPAGMGLYWIAGSVIRSIQQVIINKHLDKIDIDKVIEKNQEKYQKALEKQKEQTMQMQKYAQMSTRNLTNSNKFESALTQEEKDKAVAEASSYYESGKARKDSLLAKANMVAEFDKRNKS